MSESFFEKWQDVISQLIQEGVKVDGIVYNTHGEHFSRFGKLSFVCTYCWIYWIATPNGVYSFFNGLAPDNLFFHRVACQFVKLQLLASLGFKAESLWLPCEITGPQQEEWEGSRRK
jgi:protein arginine N-methyltransferase 2